MAQPNHDAVARHQWTCRPVKCSTQVFYERSTTFPVFYGPCPTVFEMWRCQQIQNEHIFTRISKVDEVNIYTVINTEFREHLVVIILKKLLDIFVTVFIREFNNSVMWKH